MASSISLKTLFRQKSLKDVQSCPIDVEPHHAIAPELHRSLSVWDLTAFGIAAVIGAGIFSTIGTAAFHGGPAVIFLFAVTAVVCGLSAVCYAEFASKVPAAGSAYTYAYITLGELIAWIIGWDLIMEYAIGNIAVSISWSGYFTALLEGYGLHIPTYLTLDYVSASRGFHEVSALLDQGVPLTDALTKVGSQVARAYEAWVTAPTLGPIAVICNLPALGIVTFITWVAYVGMKESKWTANAMVALKIFIILLVITVGSFYIHPGNWTPFMPNGLGGVFKGVSAVFFAYIGFDAISTTAEECRNPQHDLPRGMLYSLGICTLLYMALALVITGIVSYKELSVSDPLAFAFGPQAANVGWMSAVIAVSAVVAMASVLMVFQLGQPRVWMAMSRDGLLPKIFASVHPKYRTPWFATIVTGVMVAVPALFMNLREVTDLTSIGTLFAFLIVCGGVIRLHEDRRFGRSNPVVAGRKTFEVPIITSRYWMPFVFLSAVVSFYFLDHEHFMNLLRLDSPSTPGVFSWEATREKLPLYIYIVGMAGLTWKCVTRNWSLIPCLGLASCGYLMTELGWINWARFLIWLLIGLLIYFSYGRFRSRLNMTVVVPPESAPRRS